MIDYLDNVVLIFFGDEDSVGPEDHEKKEDAGYYEENKGVIAFVVLEIAAEVIVWVYQSQNRPSIDCQQNAEEGYKHASDLVPIDGLPVDEVVEHADEDGSKCRDGVDNIEGQVYLRPTEDEGVDCKDEAPDEQHSKLQGGAELQLVPLEFADGIGDDGLHDVSGELGLDEGHIVLVAVNEASHPEEVGDAHHHEGEVVIGDEAQRPTLQSYLARHYQSCFKSYPTFLHQMTQFLELQSPLIL